MKKITLLFLLIANTACASVGSMSYKPEVVDICSGSCAMTAAGDSLTYGFVGDDDACSYRDHLQDRLGIGEFEFTGSSSSCGNTAESYDDDYVGANGWTTTDINAELASIVSTLITTETESESWLLYFGGANDWAGCTPDFSTICSDEDLTALADRIITGANIYLTEYSTANVLILYPTPYGSSSSGSNKSATAFPTFIDSAIDTAQAGGSNIRGCNLLQLFHDNGQTSGSASDLLYDYVHPTDLGHQLIAEAVYECLTNCDNYEYCNN